MDTEYWSSRDGKKYKVESMTTSHIKRCRKLIKQGNFPPKWLEEYGDQWNAIFRFELAKRRR